MPGIIDAFLVTLGLDDREYERGAKRVEQTNKRMREEGGKTAKELDRGTQATTLSMRGLRNEVAGLLALFVGGASIANFTRSLISADATTGRLAQNLGIATEELSAWEGAVKRVGGNAGDIDGAMSAISSAFQSYKLTGSTGHDADFQGLGVTLNDLQNPATALLKISEAAERLPRPEFLERVSRLGISPATVNLLAKGRDGVQGMLAEQRRFGVTTQEASDRAQKWEETLAKLDAIIRDKVRPAIGWLIDGLSEFLEKGDGIDDIAPLITGALVAITAAAVAAFGPWMALAGAIGAVMIAWNDLKNLMNMSDEERKRFEERGAQLRGQAWEQLRNGDVTGFLGTMWEGFSERAAGNGAGGGSPGGGGNVSGLFNVLKGAFGNERARGIWAGVGAESGWDPNATNPDSGAYGLGQWLGSRKRELFRRYGKNPTADQQVEYLMWELRGGDHGGRKVLGQNTADGALLSYINDFMRPAKGAETNGDITRGRRYLNGAAMPNPGASAGSSSSSTSTTSIGQITIYTPATDAAGIAKDLRTELGKRDVILQASSGLTP